MARYAVADLHGQLDLYNQINAYVNEDDVVYALGDFGDRGPYPWETLKAVLDNPKFIYLRGNHDQMLIDAIDYFLEKERVNGSCDIYGLFPMNSPIDLLDYNGGLPTLEGWIEDSNRMRYYTKLKKTPFEIHTIKKDDKRTIVLTHAGYTPWINTDVTEDELLWGRTHFYGGVSSKDYLVIHGHTPIPYLTRSLPRNEWDTSKGYCSYCGGAKIDIDMGAHYTDQTVLINIDTLESKVFSVNSEEEDG